MLPSIAVLIPFCAISVDGIVIGQATSNRDKDDAEKAAAEIGYASAFAVFASRG
jgi:hypothetical protein